MPPAKPFYVFPSEGYFKVQFRDPETGKLHNRLSTGLSTASHKLFEAEWIAFSWLKDGIPEKGSTRKRSVPSYFDSRRVLDFLRSAEITKEDVDAFLAVLQARDFVKSVVRAGTYESKMFIEMLLEFWDYDNSPSVKEKLALGHKIGRPHCELSASRVFKYWKPYFAESSIGELTLEALKAFQVHLASESFGLSGNTRNRIMLVGTTALSWAYRNKKITSDPSTGIGTVDAEGDERGVLTPEEAKGLFSLQWIDRRSFLANLLSANTGLRRGEILALTPSDFASSSISIKKGYLSGKKPGRGIKRPKSNDYRTVPIDPRLRSELLSLAEENPTESDFVFWHEKFDDQPMNDRKAGEDLRDMLIKLLAGDDTSIAGMRRAMDYWNERNVTFHSWRHFAISHALRSGQASKVALKKTSGHATDSAFDGYADHELEKDLEFSRLAFGQVFTAISPWPTGGQK